MHVKMQDIDVNCKINVNAFGYITFVFAAVYS